jgi:glycosyltransferase involved in cell wall biosynthesis
MFIVHVNFDDGITGGATIAARRIFQAGVLAGHDAVFVCRQQTAMPGTFRSLRHPDSAFARATLTARRRLTYAPIRPFLREIYAVNWVRVGTAAFVNDLRPDIVHLHWVKGDTISVEEVAEIRSPIVWSLHDLWPCLGLESYPSGTPLRGVKGLVDRWVRRRKRVAFVRRDMFPVGPSRWCAEQAATSEVFRSATIGMIPYPVDTVAFAPRPRPEARRRFGLSADAYVVAFGANNGTRWRIKGFDRLADAIARLDSDIRERMAIVVFGEAGEPRQLHGSRLTFAGRLTDAESMAELYSAADVFALPSRQETFGQTKSEALSCGTPVIAFGQTACGEGIQHGATGWVARADDIADYAEGLRWGWQLTRDATRQQAVRQATRQSAVADFSMAAVSRRWDDWYRMVAARG